MKVWLALPLSFEYGLEHIFGIEEYEPFEIWTVVVGAARLGAGFGAFAVCLSTRFSAFNLLDAPLARKRASAYE